MWTALKVGFIDTVATDHCPFQSYEKDWGKYDFTKIPNGCAGIENLYLYMLDAANSGKISFEKVVESARQILQKSSAVPRRVQLKSARTMIL